MVRDLHHSQPVRAEDVLRPDGTPETEEERVLRKSHEFSMQNTMREISRQLTEQMQLTRDMIVALRHVTQDHVSKSGLLELKDIRQEMRVMRDSHAGFVDGIHDAVEELKAIRMLLQNAVSNGHAEH